MAMNAQTHVHNAGRALDKRSAALSLAQAPSTHGSTCAIMGESLPGTLLLYSPSWLGPQIHPPREKPLK